MQTPPKMLTWQEKSVGTYLEMGFTLASTTARTLQFLMFSGNSWIPKSLVDRHETKITCIDVRSHGPKRAPSRSSLLKLEETWLELKVEEG